jgi:glycerophosphoryl diester phosphodiesterase
VNLRRTDGRPLVIGHRGARLVAPENTLEALSAAVDAGADLVEFDVSPGLLVAHSPDEAPERPLRLEEALAYLADERIGLHLDVKLPGYERGVVEALQRSGLASRALVSTAYPSMARTFAELAPEVPCAIGYPRDRYGAARFTWPPVLTAAGAASLRAVMPARIPLLLRQARATVLALHHTLCSPAAVAAAHRKGAPVLVWTVNERADAIRFAGQGVDGIVSDDPRAILEALATLTGP